MKNGFVKQAGYDMAYAKYGIGLTKEAALPAIIPFLAATGARIAASRFGQAIGKSFLGKAWRWSNKPFFKPLAKDGILGDTAAGQWAQSSKIGKGLGVANDWLGVGTRGGAAILGASYGLPAIMPGDQTQRQVAPPTGTTLG